MVRAKAKPQAKAKPGKVLRLDQETWDFVRSVQRSGERLSDLVRRLVGLSPKGAGPVKLPEERWTLPSALFETEEEAKGEALFRAFQEKDTPEKPIIVKETYYE